jgi:hypothetical protein
MAIAGGGERLPTTAGKDAGAKNLRIQARRQSAATGIGLRTRNRGVTRTLTPRLQTRTRRSAPLPTRRLMVSHLARPLAVLAPLLLSGCLGTMPVPMGGLDRRLEAIGSSHAPALSDRWLAVIGGRGGREQVVLVDLERQMPVPLPGLNRPDAQPLAVAVDASGERLAVVRQLEGRTELVLYRRSLMALEAVAMEPPGVPRRISLRADGRELAVEVSRGGVWQVDLIQVP